ncbi:MAG TPA: SDR family oxidoreductase [Myxococcales bacterium]|nr:SDR family oxidoreductase [Myxococcales bacterium]
MILVTGATGTVGREVVALLVQAGQAVRALSRDPKKTRFDAKVEVVAGDFTKPETLEAAARGVEAVFSLAAGPDIGAHEGALARAAKKGGAKHVVGLSVMGAGSGSDGAIVKWHEAGEKAIQDSGLAWTFVRPGMFMSNALQWARSVKADGKVFLPYGEGRVAMIHPRDIAAVAVKALTTPGHEGKAYPLTGGEALTLSELVRILSEEVGRAIQYVPVPDAAAKAGMLEAGMPPTLAEALLKMAAIVRSGGAGTVLPTVEQVLGRKPLTWREWARENAAAFR